MTNHEDLMAAALEAVENAETRAAGASQSAAGSKESAAPDGSAISADISADNTGMPDPESFDLDLDFGIDLDLSGSDEKLPDIALPKPADGEIPQLTPPSSSDVGNSPETGADRNKAPAAAENQKTPPKIVLPQLRGIKPPAQSEQPSQAAKCMMLENLVQAQKVRIASLEAEIDENLQKAKAAANAEAETLSAQNKALNDRLVRLSADFDNYRKRVLRDQDQNKAQAEERIVTVFLPVIDNLERALEHARQSQDFEKLLQGVEMTHRLYVQALGKLGCTPFDSVGQNCDPNYHDVLQRVIDEDKAHNTVVQEHLKGYMMHDRVLRPALVVVSQHSEEPPTE